MLPFQPIAGKRVIKIQFPFFPVNQSKVAPMMLDMTELTVFILLFSMQPGLRYKLFADSRMAFEAIVCYQFLIGAMALSTILNAVQKGMRFVQFTRRELCLYDCYFRQKQHHDQNSDIPKVHVEPVFS